MMNVVIMGADGFIGKNLTAFLQSKNARVFKYNRNHKDAVQGKTIDLVINCAGTNRSENVDDFSQGNVSIFNEFFEFSASATVERFLNISSIKAGDDTEYGITKFNGEGLLIDLCAEKGVKVENLRLTNVFGKWARPNYNSVVATWCCRIRDREECEMHDPNTRLKLVYIDDVCDFCWMKLCDWSFKKLPTEHEVRLIDIRDCLVKIAASVCGEAVFLPATKFEEHLASTYVSYLSPHQTLFSLVQHGDSRGRFAEVVRLGNAGQVSLSSTNDNMERGKHFHMSKFERFLVVKGRAKVRMRKWGSDEISEIELSDRDLNIVTTIPGWVHSIQNITGGEMLLLIWANEEFTADSPDTIPEDV